jgi:hypothetical protein
MLAREILLPPRCASVGMAAIAAFADPYDALTGYRSSGRYCVF